MHLSLVSFLIFTLALTAHSSPILNLAKANQTSDTYIVLLNPSLSATSLRSHLAWASTTLSTSSMSKSQPPDLNIIPFTISRLHGYTITTSATQIQVLSTHPSISSIELDTPLSLPQTAPTLLNRAIQPSPPWGLARISHRKLNGSATNSYIYISTSGTYVYILDTGVRTTHQAFQGRAYCGYNAITQTAGSGCEDVNGHGTHVAGTASSLDYGVVRFAGIIAVKVLGDGGSSSVSTIIRGIQWSVTDTISKSRIGQATALLAVGGSFSAALNAAVAAAADAGLFIAVAAGNSNTDAGNYSPASERKACTVGASEAGDRKTSASNYGAAVDIYAPGQSTLSLWSTSDTAVSTISGTSSAAAHIAGLGAYFLAIEGPRGAVELCERLKEVATRDVLGGIPAGGNNLLAYNLSGE